MKKNNPIIRLYAFYAEGFRNMTTGKKLWLIVAIKLFIMFAVLRAFFFPNFLNTHFKDDKSKADYVGQQLVEHLK